MSKQRRLKVFMPADITEHVEEALTAMAKMQRYDLAIDAVGMSPGHEVAVSGDTWVRAFKTYHTVPSLGYQFLKRVQKLRPEFHGLPDREIAAKRVAGDDLFDRVERLELAYATDTLVKVLEREPSLLTSRVLILECTFLDERKSREAARAGCHIHLDDLLPLAASFQNEHLVLMHFSQLYTPDEVRRILEDRCPPELYARITPFVPQAQWPG